jgi:hypothetical protein
MLPSSVRFALTTTPVPEGFTEKSDPEITPATRFHYRGGARPAGSAAAYKLPSVERASWPEGRQSNRDVVFMRYERLADGSWEGVRRPEFRLRHHPMELPLALPLRPVPLRRAIRRLRRREPAREPIAA